MTDDRGADEELGIRMAALRPALTRFFMRSVKNHADVEDLVQEVFLRIVRRGSFDTYAGFASYALQAAASALKDRNRRRVVRLFAQHVSFDPEVHGGELPGLERELLSRDELRSTSVALAQLPERTRSVFSLRRLDGLSFAEISQRLGISVSAAEKHMLRATRHLMAATRDAS
ncbi:RNA polymerase sigma factor [Sphingobium amiense]|uniref:RNA polymerase sigma factor n=1 Tax=Sphingobium amiense TaxID=135719 RepID=UPI0013C2DEE5|nr:RNA polymerase sigma factor [Sphingobium amiense]